jgi:hypothetical protein
MRTFARLCAALLVASFLSIVGGGAPAHASTGFRWCSDGGAKPCIVSFTRNGTPQPHTAGELDLEVGTQDALDYGHAFTFSVENDPSTPSPIPLTTSDAISFVLDTGAYHPDYISGFEHQTDVDVWQDGTSGDWMLGVTGTPVKVPSGCDDTADWPWPCPFTSAGDSILFEGDVTAYHSDVNQDFVGFYAGTNVTYNGIFFDTDSTGHQFLETEAVAPHEFTDHSTVVGSIHFRVPYVMLREDFGIPNPETMTTGSMTGTVNSATATFAIAQDPDGGGIFVDVGGFTFTKRTIKVMAGTITPTRPTITAATRPALHRGHLTHTLSTPRGAKVTGYVARCVAGDTAITATGAATSKGITVYGLRAGVGYTCRVAATSKVGRSRWSTTATIPRR